MIEVQTFGCRVNKYESQIMRQLAQGSPLAKLSQDVIIFNTCAVTNSAVSEARRAIRKARRQNPRAKIIATGCAAQIEPDNFSAMPEVDLILGNEEKLHAKFYNFNDGEKIKINELDSVQDACVHMIDAIDNHTRAFVQVQNGCNHRCTFCIIPYGRGQSRSVPTGEVVCQIKKLVDNGYKEIVLTGIDLTSWGDDLPASPKLGRLVNAILKNVPDLLRLRLSSLDSIEIDDELFETLCHNPRLMPHLHLSLQSGDDMILKRMKRRHLRADTIEFCARLVAVRPEMVFGADIIAGFPTETDLMFENSLSLVETINLTYLHVFPFSPRQGTPAARMPQVPASTIKQRAKKLRALGDEMLQRFLTSRVGEIESVLVEKNGLARSQQFAHVKIAAGDFNAGEIVDVKILACQNKQLVGEAI